MARHAKGKFRTGFSALLAPLFVAAGLVAAPATTPPALAAACPSGISITPVHGTTLYWDKKGNDNATGAYLGYQISNSSGAALTSVSVTTNLGTTGNATLKRGGGQPSTESIGAVADGETAMAYFLVDVKQGAGTENVVTTLNYNSSSCTLSETLMTPSRRALAANANKLFSASVVASVGGATATAPTAIKHGSFATVVVAGNTGTIGSGPLGNREVNLTPVVYPGDFAADAWKLVDVAFRSANASCGTNGVVSNVLHISNVTSPASTNCAGLYSAAFTFQSRTTDKSTNSEVQAFSYIASGNLIKHTSPYGSTIGLPVINNASGTATTAPTIDLAQELSVAISSGAVGFTAEELSMVVYQGQIKTAEAPTFVSGTGPITNICLVNPANASDCSDGPFTVKNLKEDESLGNTDAGSFRIVQVNGQDRVQFTASATYAIGSSTDQPARIVMRLTDSSDPVQTSDAFANAAVVAGAAPTATGDTGSGALNAPQNFTVTSTGNSLTKCLFTAEPMPDPCSDVSVTADGTWVLNTSTNEVTFTPATGFAGTATIFFGVTDSQGATAFAPLEATVLGPPTATTQAASSITASSAVINGLLTTGGLSTDVKFCWGTSSILTSCTEVTPGASPLSHSAAAQSVSQSLTGLNAGTTYHFRVSADNSQSDWVDGSILSFTTPATPATVSTTGASNVLTTSATLGGSVTAGTFNATPSFILSTSNSVDGNGALSQNAGSGGGAGAAVSAGATVAITESWTGLTSGVTYYFQAVATPTTGAVVYGQVQSFTAGASATAPIPTTGSATSIENTTAILNGSVNPSNGTTSIHFCWGTSSSLTSCTKTAASPASASGGSNVPVTLAITGLVPETEYFYQVIANNGVGGDGSNDVFGSIESFTTTAPPASTTVTPIDVTGESAKLRGKVNPKGNSTTAEFCLRKASSPTEAPNTSTFCDSGVATIQVPGSVAGTEQDVEVDVTGLEPASKYLYQLKSNNGKGNGFGNIESFNTSEVPPVPLTQPATGVQRTSAKILGTVNPRNKGAKTKFCWGDQPDLFGCTFQTVAQNQNGNSPLAAELDLTGLTPGETYYYRIIGNNGVGGLRFPSFSSLSTSSLSSLSFSTSNFTAFALEEGDVDGDILSFTTLAALSATTSTATSVDSTSATLNGSVNPGEESTSVSFCYSKDDSTLATCLATPAATPSPITGSTSQAVSANLSGLDPATTYYFKVVATNTGQGTEEGSILSFTTAAAPAAPQLTASTDPATSVTRTTAVLNGTVNPGNATTTVSFCYGTDQNLTGCQSVTATQSGLSGTTSTPVSVSVSGLAPLTTYYFRVLATNTTPESENGSILSFTTQAALTAITGSASSVTSNSATASGTVNPGGESTTVTFCYGTSSTLIGCQSSTAAQSPLTGSSSSTVTVNITGLLPSTTYYFHVVATNTGQGTQSGSPVSFTTLAAPVTSSPSTSPPSVTDPVEPVEPAEPEVPSVELDMGDATEDTEPVVLKVENGEVTLPEPTMTKPGHTFAGWEIEGVVYQPGAVITVEKSLRASALWVSQESSGEGVLADTGTEVSHWLAFASMLLAAGSALLVYARRRA